MHNKLAQILKQKQQLLQARRKKFTFKTALSQPGHHIIAEIKRQSPSKGKLAPITAPTQLANHYEQAGAQAISVLTDANFAGSMQDLQQVSSAVCCPTLCKDFIIDPKQICDAVAAGASAVLLITAVLGQRLASFITLCRQLNIDALVETHNAAEIDIALSAGAEIIGINNRNLKDFSVDTQRALQLIDNIPNSIIKIAESGITDAKLAKEYFAAGFNAILIGEALVTAKDPAPLIQAMRGQYVN